MAKLLELNKEYRVWQDKATGLWMWALTSKGKAKMKSIEASIEQWHLWIKTIGRKFEEEIEPTLINPLDVEIWEWSPPKTNRWRYEG